jgi:hypothetical protein
MTGSASKGNGGIYHYYHCQRKYGCKTNVRASEANLAFLNYLASFEVNNEVVELYRNVLEDVFRSNEGEKESERRRIIAEIAKLDNQQASLDEKFLGDLISPVDYKSLKSKMEDRKNDLAMKHVAITKMARDFSKYISYSLTVVSNIAQFYKAAAYEVKRRIIGLIFPESLIFTQEGYRTAKMNEVFRLITATSKEYKKKQPGRNAELSTWAPPVGLEPTTL